MKKQLLLLSMISLLTLAGCGDISQQQDDNGNQIIVKIGDKNYTANELFEEYSNTSTGASQYYNAVYDVLIQEAQELTDSIKSKVTSEIDSFLQKVETSAKENGTSIASEKSKALEEAGVETLEELETVYTLNQKKSTYEERFYDDNTNDALLEEFINYYAPYHIRHILAKTSGGSSLYNDTIEKDDATNIANIVIDLASGKQSFATIAKSYIDKGDEGSANVYGDVGVMSTTTSFVSEFKYAVYQYDAYYNDKAKANVTSFNTRQASRKIGESDYEGASLIPYAANSKNETYLKNSVNHIDYSTFTALKEYANITVDHLKADKKEDRFLPRNIIFNEKLNNHALGVITKGTTGPSTSNRFQTVPGLSESNSEEDKILCDETGRPILVTRAGSGSGDSGYQGIHFIIIQKSPFVEEKAGKLLEELKAYYNLKAHDENKSNTYVTFIDSTSDKDYTDRVDNLEKDIKAFDSYMSYRIYENALKDLEAKGKKVTLKTIKMGDKEVSIDTLIKNYMNANRTSAAYSAKETYEDSWDSYIRLLQIQDQVSGLKVTAEKDYTGYTCYVKENN